MPGTISVTFECPAQLAALRPVWRELESRSDATLFTRWSWIGAWLANLPTDVQPQLLVARRGPQIVGLGLLTLGRVRLFRALPVRCWYLHSTGDERLDGMTIEYNGFLVDSMHAAAVRGAMLDHLIRSTEEGRVEIRNADNNHAELARTCAPGTVVREHEQLSYQVTLDRVRDAAGGYLELLSANTRSQLRRSLKAYEALGPLQLDKPSDLAEALQYFCRLRELHAQAWQRKGQWSDFGCSATALSFHVRFITDAFDRGEVQLMRITAGNSEVGYLYNLVQGGKVMFYQSGLTYGLLDKHERPGMVCHSLAVQHNAELNHELYDFLAGDYRYKASLSTHFKRQATCLFQSGKRLARFDARLRSHLSAARQRRQDARPTADSESSLTGRLVELR